MAILTLPRSAVKEMSKEYIKIELLEEQIPKKKINKAVLEAARGILKHHKIEPLEYQKKIREEWER